MKKNKFPTWSKTLSKAFTFHLSIHCLRKNYFCVLRYSIYKMVPKIMVMPKIQKIHHSYTVGIPQVSNLGLFFFFKNENEWAHINLNCKTGLLDNLLWLLVKKGFVNYTCVCLCGSHFVIFQLVAIFIFKSVSIDLKKKHGHIFQFCWWGKIGLQMPPRFIEKQQMITPQFKNLEHHVTAGVPQVCN